MANLRIFLKSKLLIQVIVCQMIQYYEYTKGAGTMLKVSAYDQEGLSSISEPLFKFESPCILNCMINFIILFKTINSIEIRDCNKSFINF